MADRSGAAVGPVLRRAGDALVGAGWKALRLLPPRAWVTVFGWPDEEESTLRITAALAAGYPGRAILLAHDVVVSRQLLEAEAGPEAAERVEVVDKSTIRAAWCYLWSEVVFYTHGLYGSRGGGRRRVHVNLWHGHGPKRTENASFAARLASDAIIANTRTWGAHTVRALGGADEQLLVTGNPRQDAFAEPAGDEVLGALGVDPARPIVLWMPTYRGTNARTPHSWSDGDELSHSGVLRDRISELAAAAEAAQVQLLVKAHPLDRDALQGLGVPTIGSDDLRCAGTSLYRLLARTDALVTDYSSVWVEYLDLDKPVALFCPDLDTYERARGFKSPGLREVAAELLLSPGSTYDFFASVDRSGDWRREARHAAGQRLQVAPPGRRTERVLASVATLAKTSEARRRFTPWAEAADETGQLSASPRIGGSHSR